MSLEHYGVWRATARRVSAETAEDDSESPHIHLFYDDQRAKGLRASINLKSKTPQSEVAHYRDGDFRHPVLDHVRDLPVGWSDLASAPGSGALDYLRGDLFDLRTGRLLPHDIPGRKNDLLDVIMPVLRKACAHGSTIWLFGEPYDDWKGIHNIHMNQGSAQRYAGSDGVWQDGGLIIHDRSRRKYVAIFLAFGSQVVETDKQGKAAKDAKRIADVFDVGREG